MALDLLVGAAFVLFMLREDAPSWALALAFYMTTFPSRVWIAGDLAAVKAAVDALKEPEGDS